VREWDDSGIRVSEKVMAKFVDPLIVNSLLDANILNDVASGLDSDVNEIVALAESGAAVLMLPYSVKDEVENPNTPNHVKRAVTQFIFTEKVDLTEGERLLYQTLLNAGKGDAEAKNIAKDLQHVCEAAKYGGYFITRDKRLLMRARVAAEIAGVEIVTPREFLNRVEQSRVRAAKFSDHRT
jgi:hypothetical protein